MTERPIESRAMMLTVFHGIGMIPVTLLVIATGVLSGRRVRSAQDFSTADGRASSPVVAGTMTGTLVSGASTIGTAQLAFQLGFSAWWFTLGAGVGCAVLGLALTGRIRASGAATLPELLADTYGPAMRAVSCIFTALGIFFNVIAQILAFSSLLTSLSTIRPFPAELLGALGVLAYVLLGGVWGTGLTGIVKLLLLYSTIITCGVVALGHLGGIAGMTGAFPHYPWFSLFGRGPAVDSAAGFSLIVGVLSTQTYFQALASGRSTRASRAGSLASAFLIPPLGLGSILVGLFMRARFPAMASAEALPAFILNFLPPLAAGAMLATLVLTIVGGWAGLVLGISTMITKDLYQSFLRPKADSRESLLVQRALIVVLCLLGLLCASGNRGSLILGWSFMSMGLRGCTVLFPLLGALFVPRLVTPSAGIASAVAAPLADVLWKVVLPGLGDPLYPGLAVGVSVLIAVSLATRKPRLIPAPSRSERKGRAG